MAIYPTNVGLYLGPIAQEDHAMFTRRTNDRFAGYLFTGLVIAVTVAIASLGHAVAGIQIIA